MKKVAIEISKEKLKEVNMENEYVIDICELFSNSLKRAVNTM